MDISLSKPKHETLPIWITETGHIFLDTTVPGASNAVDFLVAIAEPQSRPEFIHEYCITDYSLYAAVSVGFDCDDIIGTLDRLCKTEVPLPVLKKIESATERCGKIRLVLFHNKYFIESKYVKVINEFITDEAVMACINPNPITTTIDVSHEPSLGNHMLGDQDLARVAHLLNDEDEEGSEFMQSVHEVVRYEVFGHSVSILRERAHELSLPLIEEYDFKHDTTLPSIGMKLNATTMVRPYQEKALAKMFSTGRARSGIIVLPCGAGKTLVGVNATCKVDKRTIVLCTNNLSLEQWKNQFLEWAAIDESMIGCFTSEKRDPVRPIMLSTYSMMTYSGKRKEESQVAFEQLTSLEWGLLVFDEVHVAPARSFRKVIGSVKAHCMLGLSATLVREDMKIDDLNFLIGPKIYEADWLFLRSEGFLANVKCCEVLCPMTSEFFRQYLPSSANKRSLLWIMNPNKIRCCEFLIRYHEAKNDKILVFSDNLYALHTYARLFNRPFIDGSTPHAERTHFINKFKQRGELNTLFISKVGDTSIDLPDANVVIQVSAQYGSRRQEAQRLGRILRPKEQTIGEFNAFFYSLVSRDTKELYFSAKRQQFLMNQGFAYESRIYPNFESFDPSLLTKMVSKEDELALLADVMRANDSAGVTEKSKDEEDEVVEGRPLSQQRVQRSRVPSRSLTSAGNRRNHLFIKRDKKRNELLGKR
ncbi:hypothetical protein P9112_004437 [Eukaryota sp. TZLM1-RC]